MSTNDYILNLLNIEDKNIFILKDSIQETFIKNVKHKIVEGFLSYNPNYCPCCGCINQGFNDIIKWGFKKNCKIKIPNISNCRSLLILHKQRFKCKNCDATFIAETSLVDKYKNISHNTDLKIRLDLMTKQSEKDIAKQNNVSISKVDKILNNISSHTVMRHEHLPINMNWDEFKATKDTKGKMAFIIVDNDSGNIFDIQNSRKNIDLEKYFKRFSLSDRRRVKLISTDFYSGYISIAKTLFKNADIVIDRFHIVTQAYNALNNTRTKLCTKTNKNYTKLKKYWKLIVKNERDLTDEKKYSKCFRKEMSQKEIVTYLINTDKILKATYNCYQGIINSLRERDLGKFKSIIFNQNKDISKKMKRAIRLYQINVKYIENSFKYNINNGIIEGKNNLVKTIKRIAFGYRKYEHFIARIFLIESNIKG